MLTILLIEDYREDKVLIDKYLREEPKVPYKLLWAQTLTEGHQLIREHPVGIVLLDLNLPDSTGMPTFESLLRAAPEVPLIVLTGLADYELGNKAVGLGAQDFVDKNQLSGVLLWRTIQYARQRHQLHRNLEEAHRIARMGTWTYDASSKTLSLSQATLEMLRIPEALWPSSERSYLELVHPDDQPHVVQALQRVREDHEGFHLEHRLLIPGLPQPIYVNLKGEPVRSIRGEITNFKGTIQDVSEQEQIKQLQADYERAQMLASLRQQFLERTSHEIRTPLNPILLLTRELLNSELTRDQREALDTIRYAGETLLAVVNDILDLAKIEAGKITFRKETFELANVLNYLRDMMDPPIQAKSIALTFEIAPEVPGLIIGDHVRLTQILLNLLSNAVKFTNTGSIVIRILADPMTPDKLQRLRFEVIDTGIGIPANKLQLIWESFQQVDSTELRRAGGSGLGLTIVRQLVQLQGGTISVESRQGQGSRFFFDLEFGIPDGLEKQEDVLSINTEAMQGLTILLVEDNAFNQIVTQHLLNKWGIAVDIAQHGQEALDILTARTAPLYDLILMDVQMPIMNGYEATRMIRQSDDETLRSIPIVALTANVFKGSIEECIAAGMDDYVSKPIDIAALYTKIVQHTNRIAEHVTLPLPTQALTRPDPMENTNADMYHPPFIDLTYLNEISGGDRSIMIKTIERFLQDAPELMTDIEAHADQKDPVTLAKAAHKLRSSSMFLGIEKLGGLLAKIEYEQAQHSAAQISEMVRKARLVLSASMVELETALQAMR
ncbi:MAG: response regulator [Bacteroidia bacterium]|nr:response regulator [Bacteroidia bacterium]